MKKAENQGPPSLDFKPKPPPRPPRSDSKRMIIKCDCCGFIGMVKRTSDVSGRVCCFCYQSPTCSAKLREIDTEELLRDLDSGFRHM